jgi:hyperosmotically inducible periplasmic protein
MRHFGLNSYTTLMTSAVLIQAVGIPMQASTLDSRIEFAAKNSYNFKTYLKEDSIKVESSEGVVTLTGVVSEDFHKSLAQETVAGLPGVVSVNNQLAVAGEQPSDRSDGWVTMKVKTVLALHKNVRATTTEVHTQNGVVTLTGEAHSEAQKQLTGEYALDVEGVTEVRNELTVAKAAPRTVGEKVDDASITAQVKTSLLFHKSTHTLATKVVTRNGVVTLRGEARNGAEKRLVTRLAEDIDGVKLVNNLMTIQ